jgi:hypothetical protein
LRIAREKVAPAGGVEVRHAAVVRLPDGGGRTLAACDGVDLDVALVAGVGARRAQRVSCTRGRPRWMAAQRTALWSRRTMHSWYTCKRGRADSCACTARRCYCILGHDTNRGHAYKLAYGRSRKCSWDGGGTDGRRLSGSWRRRCESTDRHCTANCDGASTEHADVH